MRLFGLLFITLIGLLSFGVFANTWESIVEKSPTDSMIEDKEYLEAVTWMYSEQMTKYINPIAFQPESLVTREQAAKFFVQYATKIAFKTIDTTRYCAFDDLESADPTLKNDILQSCLLYLFKGTQWQFFPKELLTKAQVLTVLLRITESQPLDESWNPRWLKPYEIAYAKQYTKVTDVMALDQPITRYELALLLWRVKGGNWEEIDEKSKEIEGNEGK